MNDHNEVNIGDNNTIGAISTGRNSQADGKVNINKYSDNNDAFTRLFHDLYQRIGQIEDRFDQQQAQLVVDALKDELSKQEQADEAILEKRLLAMKQLLNDGLEVALATIVNPALGFSLIAQKVAQKIKQQIKIARE